MLDRNQRAIPGSSTDISLPQAAPSSSSGTPPQFNIKKFQDLLIEGYPYAIAAEGQELVLVIGPTGVGKSTTANYLLKHPMHRVITEEGIPAIETVDTPSVAIGHKIEPFTLYAKPIQKPIQGKLDDWILVDCPGFQKTRMSLEETVMESVGTELVIRHARRIKGMMILMEYNDIASSRSVNLQNLLKTLMALFKDPFSMLTSSRIIITKIPRGEPREDLLKEVIAYLRRFKLDCESKRQELKQKPPGATSPVGLTAEDYGILATYLKAVEDAADNIILVNPLDQGESRDEIINAINGIKPPKRGLARVKAAIPGLGGTDSTASEHSITIDDFNFHDYDDNRPKFNEAIYYFSCDGMQVMQAIQILAEKLAAAQGDIIDAERRSESEKILIQNLQQPIVNEQARSVQQKASIEVWENTQKQNNEIITAKEALILKLESKQTNLQKELGEINVATNLLHYRDSINESMSFWKIISWRSKQFSTTAPDGVTFSKIKKNLKNGQWEGEEGGEGKSSFKVKYQSIRKPQPAYAQVKAYIETRCEPGNAARIKQIQKRLPEIATELQEARAKVAELKQGNAVLARDIEATRAGLLNDATARADKLKQAQQQVQEFRKRIQDCQSQIEQYRQRGMELMEQFKLQCSNYDIVAKIGKIIPFPSKLVNVFMDCYSVFLTELKQNQYNFEEPAAAQSLSPALSSSSSSLIDPLGNPVLDPITVNDVIFDKAGVIQYFQGTKQPLQFTHPTTRAPTKLTYEEWSTGKWHSVSGQLKPILGSRVVEEKTTRLNQYHLFAQSSQTPEQLTSRVQDLEEEETRLNVKLVKLQTTLEQVRIERERILSQISSSGERKSQNVGPLPSSSGPFPLP